MAFNCEVHAIASRTVVTLNLLYKSNECSDYPFRWCTFPLTAKMSFTIVFEDNVVIELSSDVRALRVDSPSACMPAGRNSSGRAFAGSANHKQQLAHQAVVQASHRQDQQQPQGNDFALHNSSCFSHLANALTPDETLLSRAQSPDLSGKHARRLRTAGRAAEVY